MNIDRLKQQNKERWEKAKLTVPFYGVAKRLVDAKDRYKVVSDKTGVPWFIIAVIHERESSQRWDRSLAQGDPWDRVSTHVPKGRGPFSSWEEAAIDALVNCAPHAAKWGDWSSGGALTLLEEYNGLGYAYKGLPSPYIWSGTDQYQHGKYVADGIFDANAVDHQLGCAGLIMTMMELDTSIAFADKKKTEDLVAVVSPKKSPLTPKNTTITTVIGGAVVASSQTHDYTNMIIIISLGVIVAIAVHFLWPKKTN